MQSLYVVFLFITITFYQGSLFASKTNSSTEASVCTNCTTNNPDDLIELSKTIKNAQSDKKCEQTSLFFDPNKKSILGEDSANQKRNVTESIARSFFTCIYGAADGVIQSVSDLVMAIPHLLQLSWKGLKWTGEKVSGFDFGGWVKSFSAQKVVSKTTGAFSVTKDTIANSFKNANKVLYDAYETGGVAGSVAAVASAAWGKSPHMVVQRYLSKMSSLVYEAINKEWSAFSCLSTEAKSQVMCKVAAYISTDVMTGKLIISALSKSGKLKDAIASVRSQMERAPIIGDWLVKDLVAVNSKFCDKVDDTEWKIDARMKLQGADVDVARVGDAVFARGISPKTKTIGCFKVVGKLAEQAGARIANTERLIAKAENKQSVDFFSTANPNIARTTEDYIIGINKKAEVATTNKESLAIAAALEANPGQMSKYGDLLRNVSELREKAQRASKIKADDAQKVMRDLNLAEDTVKALNKTLSNMKKSDSINIGLVNEAVEASLNIGSIEAVGVINSALKEFAQFAKKSPNDVEKAIKNWESFLAKDRPHLSDEQIERATKCLFVSGTR